MVVVVVSGVRGGSDGKKMLLLAAAIWAILISSEITKCDELRCCNTNLSTPRRASSALLLAECTAGAHEFPLLLFNGDGNSNK